MLISILQLCFSLIIILAAAEIFTNALEHLGQKLQISDGVTGSLFAAIGTALPETIIPLLAITSGSSVSGRNEEISVGAILGAPLMLATLSICLMGLATLRQRGLNGFICPEPKGFRRDTCFFLIAFILAALAMYIPHPLSYLRATISIGLILLYIFYVFRTVRASVDYVESGGMTEAGSSLYLSRAGIPVNGLSIGIQVIFSTAILIGGAFWFIDGVVIASGYLGISVLLLSLIIIPVATELPEKINSILWIRRGKDTLAVGNITGAMVFQGTILPAIGITLTPWEPREEVLTGIMITLAAAFWLWLNAIAGRLHLWCLLINGLLYVTYITISMN